MQLDRWRLHVDVEVEEGGLHARITLKGKKPVVTAEIRVSAVVAATIAGVISAAFMLLRTLS